MITYHTVSSKKYIFDRLETQQQINKLEKNFPAGNLESVKLAVPIVSDTNYVIMAPEKFFKNEDFNIAAKIILFLTGRNNNLKISEIPFTLSYDYKIGQSKMKLTKTILLTLRLLFFKGHR